MANLHPHRSPATEFKPDHPKYGGKKMGTPNRATVLSRAPRIRSLAEIMADENSFRGSMAELLEAVARDGSQPIDIRLSCANALLRTAPPSGDEALAKMSEAELERELRRLEEQRRAAVVIGEATVVEPEPTQPISNALMDARLRAKLED